jgi:valyl-tRNA synthetase
MPGPSSSTMTSGPAAGDPGDRGPADGGPAELSLADRWIRSRLAAMLARVESGFADYRLDMVANALYEFTWNEFCDWYLELSKAVLQSDGASEAAKRGTRRTLISTLEVLLRALHPLAPFISEEIWQRVRSSAGVAGETIMLCEYPTAQSIEADSAAEPEMQWVMNFVLGVRQIRGEMDIAPSRRLKVLLHNAGPADLEYLARNHAYLTRLAGIAATRVLGSGESAPISAAALVGKLEILVPMAGLIEPRAELDRLAKRQRRAESDYGKLAAKLANGDFSKNAPTEVVAKDQARLSELRIEIDQLANQIARVKALSAL